jgi:hypothetical protein
MQGLPQEVRAMYRSGIAKPGLIVVLLAMVLVALAVAGCGEASPATNGEPQAGEAPSGAQDRDTSGDGGDTGEPATSGEGLPLPQMADRKIIRTATLELEVEDVSAAVREVEGAAVAAGGFVSESSVFVDAPPGRMEAATERRNGRRRQR